MADSIQDIKAWTDIRFKRDGARPERQRPAIGMVVKEGSRQAVEDEEGWRREERIGHNPMSATKKSSGTE